MTGTVAVGNLPAVQQVAGTITVSSLPAMPPPARMQLVGFTAATFTGDQGVFGFTAACQLEFSGSRMCLVNEAITTTTIPTFGVGTENAWIEPGRGLSGGVGATINCYGWTNADENDYVPDWRLTRRFSIQ